MQVSSFTRRGVVSAAIAAPLGLAATLAKAADTPLPPSLDDLTREPELRDAALSPDGARLAVIRERRVDGKRRSSLEIFETGALEKPVRVIPLGDHKIDHVTWAKHDRLLIRASYEADGKGNKTGLWYGDTFVPIPVRRLVSVALDDKGSALMFGNHETRLNNFFDLSVIADMLHDDPRRIIMQSWDSDRKVLALYYVDVYTGAATLFERGMLRTQGWFLQKGTPVLRFDANYRRSTLSVHARPPGATEWKLARTLRREEWKNLSTYNIVGSTPQPGVVYALHREEGENTRSLRRYDLHDLTFGPPLQSRADLDIEGAILDEAGELVGVAYTDDTLLVDWADKSMNAHFKGLNAYFDNRANIYPRSVDRGHQRMLLRAQGPEDAGSFHFYDRTKGKVITIGEQKPWLVGRLAPMKALRIRSRDGAELRAYLTLPERPGPRPLVVMPHGGPELRDSLAYDDFVQALAARGWAVLQPNFRGSGGFGEAFVAAGRKRWGDLMQEDVDDCVAHVVEAGGIDRSRLAIMGASYGGYAALMGAVRNTTPYRCAVAIAGPSDLIEFLKYEKADGEDSFGYQYWTKTMGDMKADAALLRAASPASRADAVRMPVLLVHGREDEIVPPNQSKIMAQALKKAGKVYEHHELKGVAHGGWEVDTIKDILGRSIAFIDKAFT